MSRLLQTRLGTAFVSFCALVAIASPARADDQTIRNADSEVWGAFGTSLFNYQEEIGAPNIPDSEHGWLPSLAVGASYLTSQDFYFALDGAANFGNAHYNGSILDTNTGFFDIPFQDTTREVVSTVDGKAGKAIALSNEVMLTPYAEVGFRYWHRDLGQGQTENYQNFDAQAGLMVQVSPINKLVLMGYGSVGPTFAARMRTAGEDYYLGGSGMYKVGGKVAYGLTPRLDVFTTVDYDAFRYGESPLLADGSLEPSSKTEETTVRVGLGYHFK
jgi:hypothetical protein